MRDVLLVPIALKVQQPLLNVRMVSSVHSEVLHKLPAREDTSVMRILATNKFFAQSTRTAPVVLQDHWNAFIDTFALVDQRWLNTVEMVSMLTQDHRLSEV